jgi:long-chain acyl-CoA synthetase
MPLTSPAFATALDMARSACERRADAPLLHYFGAALTGREVADASDALACALAARGVTRGDRVALFLQNVPQMPIAVIAVWTLGAVIVPVNPMLRERELAGILADSGARALISLEALHETARPVLPEVAITTSPLEYLDEVPPVLAGETRRPPPDAEDLMALIAAHAGERPAAVAVAPDDIACLTYTSGTTGPPKGAMNLHRNVAFASAVWRDWPQLGQGDVNLAMAPLFHITGLIAGLGASLAGALPLVLGHRFEAAATLELIAARRPTFTVAAITAYQALMRAPGFAAADLSCLRAAYTGGAPVAPAVAAAWRRATGVRLHNAYGLTETTSPLTLTPHGTDAPVDPATGALSVGVPVFDSRVDVLGDDGAPLPPGEVGEIAASGPQVVPGYWGKPEETAIALPDGRLRTGDVGYMDADGCVYLVDRRKDMIIASGYKVWPREVEDVLYTHPAVREAAVIGVPDEYRGETVKAFVSLHAAATPDELIAHCRERMAAYKYPRAVEIVDELPKSVSGKILRRELRGR